MARLLDLRGELRPELILKVFCPVSVRDDDQRMQLGNRISAMLVPLAVGEPDPLRAPRPRCGAAPPTSRNAARRWARPRCSACPSTRRRRMLGLAARAAHAQRFANLMITNIPGPQVPLYCLGARMLEVYPIVPLSRNLTLNVAILSYCGQLHFGLVGDGAAGRDLEIARRRDRGRVRGAGRPRRARGLAWRREPIRRSHRRGHRPLAAADPQPVRQRRHGGVGGGDPQRRPARRLPRRRGRPRGLRAATRDARAWW